MPFKIFHFNKDWEYNLVKTPGSATGKIYQNFKYLFPKNQQLYFQKLSLQKNLHRSTKKYNDVALFIMANRENNPIASTGEGTMTYTYNNTPFIKKNIREMNVYKQEKRPRYFFR